MLRQGHRVREFLERSTNKNWRVAAEREVQKSFIFPSSVRCGLQEVQPAACGGLPNCMKSRAAATDCDHRSGRDDH